MLSSFDNLSSHCYCRVVDLPSVVNCVVKNVEKIDGNCSSVVSLPVFNYLRKSSCMSRT